MSDLGEFSKALDEAAKRRIKDRADFQKKLGEPTVFLADPEDPRFGVGYWKGDNGVFSYRRYHNGYDPNSRMEFDNALIDLLVTVRS